MPHLHRSLKKHPSRGARARNWRLPLILQRIFAPKVAEFIEFPDYLIFLVSKWYARSVRLYSIDWFTDIARTYYTFFCYLTVRRWNKPVAYFTLLYKVWNANLDTMGRSFSDIYIEVLSIVSSLLSLLTSLHKFYCYDKSLYATIR